jgi:hypothetical protein
MTLELASLAAACDTAALMTQRAIRFFAFTSGNGAGLSGV